ncbi:CoA pyrophosphatase [Balneatrix alpica]|uniref:CoA pyrophosphatase n=1 Tax=Balneatrix alpica TaxID=75684 RepID=A0ABV5Z967_9GAMM|nr:CoA pyrophosphatase [Balneatrix alpica]
MLQLIEYRIREFQPRQMGAGKPQAGVLIALTEHRTDPHMILTKRAQGLSTHGGEIAFPGGKRDPEDSSIEATALREAEEEIGLAPSQVRVLGRSGQVISRWGLQVTPVVGIIPDNLHFRINKGELESVFRVPLSFFLEDRRSRTDIINLRGLEAHIPCWHYEGYEIWGLTAYMIAEFLTISMQADFALHPPK